MERFLLCTLNDKNKIKTDGKTYTRSEIEDLKGQIELALECEDKLTLYSGTNTAEQFAIIYSKEETRTEYVNGYNAIKDYYDNLIGKPYYEFLQYRECFVIPFFNLNEF